MLGGAGVALALVFCRAIFHCLPFHPINRLQQLIRRLDRWGSAIFGGGGFDAFPQRRPLLPQAIPEFCNPILFQQLTLLQDSPIALNQAGTLLPVQLP